MKNRLLKWLNIAGFFFFWLLGGVLILAIFAGVLWVSGGSYSGYPALLLAGLVAVGLVRLVFTGTSSPAGKTLRLTPVALFFLIVLWAMFPMASDVLEVYPKATNSEMWDLGNNRVVAMAKKCGYLTEPKFGDIHLKFPGTYQPLKTLIMLIWLNLNNGAMILISIPMAQECLLMTGCTSNS